MIKILRTTSLVNDETFMMKHAVEETFGWREYNTISKTTKNLSTWKSKKKVQKFIIITLKLRQARAK